MAEWRLRVTAANAADYHARRSAIAAASEVLRSSGATKVDGLPHRVDARFPDKRAARAAERRVSRAVGDGDAALVVTASRHGHAPGWESVPALGSAGPQAAVRPRARPRWTASGGKLVVTAEGPVVLEYSVFRAREQVHVAAFDPDGWFRAQGHAGEKPHRGESVSAAIARITGLPVVETDLVAARFLDGARERAARTGGVRLSAVVFVLVVSTLGLVVTPFRSVRGVWRAVRNPRPR